MSNKEDKLDKISKILHDDLFDSKDWKFGNEVERVEWILSMYESMKEREKIAWDMLERLGE